MIIEAFKPEHLQQIILQPEQDHPQLRTDEYGRALLCLGPAFTARTDRIVACFGIAEEEGEPMLWSYIASKAPLLALTRLAYRVFEVFPHPKLVSISRADFKAGCHWLEILGFTPERALPGYGPNGEDCLRYVRLA